MTVASVKKYLRSEKRVPASSGKWWKWMLDLPVKSSKPCRMRLLKGRFTSLAIRRLSIL